MRPFEPKIRHDSYVGEPTDEDGVLYQLPMLKGPPPKPKRGRPPGAKNKRKNKVVCPCGQSFNSEGLPWQVHMKHYPSLCRRRAQIDPR